MLRSSIWQVLEYGDCNMFNDNVTIYNYVRENGIVSWFRTQIENVMWSEKTETSVSSDRHINIAQTVSLTMPTSKIKCDKEYMPSVEWKKLSASDKGLYWTINASGQDVIVKGLVDKELSETYPPTELKKDFENVATVVVFTDTTTRNGLKHYKVGAK